MKLKKIFSSVIASALLLTAQPVNANPSRDASAAEKSRVSVHDPSIFRDTDGKYYVFGSHIDAAQSDDLQSWTSFTNGYATVNNAVFGDLSGNLKKAFDWAGEDLEDCEGGFAVWAPDVFYNNQYINRDGSKGAYMMYFCTSSTYMRSVICYAVSQNVTGPYEFVDTLIYSGFTAGDSYAKSATKNVNRKYTSTNIDELIASGEVTYNEGWFNKGNYNNQLYPNAIDPTVYTDTNGNMYMCYGSWSGGIFALELDPATGRLIHPKSGKTADGRMIDSYFGTKISGGYGKSGEAPYIRYNADTGYYYLWVTYGGLFSEGGYNMRVFRATSPFGPFTDPAGNQAVLPSAVDIDPIGLKVMGNYKFSSLDRAYMACGHNSVLRDKDGQWYLVNHARFDDGTEYHEVRVHAMYFNSEGWPVVVPYEYSGDKMHKRGYNSQDIVGDYEFIDHGLDTGKTIHSAVKITLNSDGSVSGGVTGTWSEDGASAQAHFVIGGKSYDGYFIPSQDEKANSTRVMTFTAVGTDNHSVWGVQTKPFTGGERTGLADYTNENSVMIYDAENLAEPVMPDIIGNENLSELSYHIINKNSGMCLEVKNGSTESGTNIQQWEKNVGPHNEWRIHDEGGGYYSLRLRSNETMAVTVDGTDGTNGLNVVLERFTGGRNQLFKFEKNGLYYGILSLCSGGKGALDVYEWSTKMGGNVNQWEYKGYDCQLWELEPVCPAVNDGEYYIHQFDGWVVPEGDFVVQSRRPEKWTITRLDDGTYSIKDTNGMAMTVQDPEDIDGMTNIILGEYTGDDSQKFKIYCNKNGEYSFLSVSSGLKGYVDIGIVFSDERGLYYRLYDVNTGTGYFNLLPVPKEKAVTGDVNGDGEFNIADLVALGNYLLGSGKLKNAAAAELCGDDRIDTFDLVKMRKMLTEK